MTESANLPRLIGRHALSVALRGSRSASVLKASFVAARHDFALLSQAPLQTLRQDRHARRVSGTDTTQQEQPNETTMRFVVCPNRQRSRLRRSYPWFSSIKHRLTFRPRSTMSSRVAVSPQRTAGAIACPSSAKRASISSSAKDQYPPRRADEGRHRRLFLSPRTMSSMAALRRHAGGPGLRLIDRMRDPRTNAAQHLVHAPFALRWQNPMHQFGAAPAAHKQRNETPVRLGIRSAAARNVAPARLRLARPREAWQRPMHQNAMAIRGLHLRRARPVPSNQPGAGQPAEHPQSAGHRRHRQHQPEIPSPQPVRVRQRPDR